MKPIFILEEKVSPHNGELRLLGHSKSVFSGLNIVFCGLGQSAQVLPAQGSQEHDKRQVNRGVVASLRDQLTTGKLLCPDCGDDLPCFIRR